MIRLVGLSGLPARGGLLKLTMKIKPTSDILIKSQHCATGQVQEVDDATGKLLIAQGLATLATAPAQPVIETAAAPAAPETTTAPAAKRRK